MAGPIEDGSDQDDGPQISGQVQVLLVASNLEDIALVGRLLASSKEPEFELAIVKSSSAALRLMRKASFDVVLLDLSLVDARGLGGLHDFALADPRTPIIVLAGKEQGRSRVQALRRGAQDYLVKDRTDDIQFAQSIQMAIERKSFEADLSERANFDQLTGLVNRTLFRDRLAHALARARRMRSRVALLYIDLDGFKAVNDTLGHAAGDEVLQQVAERFRCLVRGSETVARLGGDEFTILIEPVQDVESARRAAERIRVPFRAPLTIAGKEVLIRPSIGLALFPDHASDDDALLRAADTAMFRAKRTGGDRIWLFDSGSA